MTSTLCSFIHAGILAINTGELGEGGECVDAFVIHGQCFVRLRPAVSRQYILRPPHRPSGPTSHRSGSPPLRLVGRRGRVAAARCRCRHARTDRSAHARAPATAARADENKGHSGGGIAVCSEEQIAERGDRPAACAARRTHGHANAISSGQREHQHVLISESHTN